MPGKTDKKALAHSLESLENMQTDISGIIFNGVDSKNSYGSYYYYYQSYGENRPMEDNCGTPQNPSRRLAIGTAKN